MKRDMKKWLSSVLEAPVKGAMPILSFPAVSLMGITVRELISSGETQARGMKLVAERVPSLASVSMMDLSVEAELFGSEIHVSDDEVPTVVGAILADEDDAKRLKVPDPRDGRTGLYVRALGEATRLIEDRPVLAGCIGPYSLAGRLMGVSDIMVNCYCEPDMVRETMEKTTAFIINYINEYKRVGANGVVMAEPLTGLLSPALAEEFSTPYVRRVREAVADDSFLFVYHNCGDNVYAMIDSLLTIGAHAYHFGNSTDLVKLMPSIPSTEVIMGNLDPAGILRNGTPDMVREKTAAMMKALCGYKNYVISSGCDIPPATPWENIDAFFETVACGRSPAEILRIS